MFVPTKHCWMMHASSGVAVRAKRSKSCGHTKRLNRVQFPALAVYATPFPFCQKSALHPDDLGRDARASRRSRCARTRQLACDDMCGFGRGHHRLARLARPVALSRRSSRRQRAIERGPRNKHTNRRADEFPSTFAAFQSRSISLLTPCFCFSRSLWPRRIWCFALLSRSLSLPFDGRSTASSLAIVSRK